MAETTLAEPARQQLQQLLNTAWQPPVQARHSRLWRLKRRRQVSWWPQWKRLLQRLMRSLLRLLPLVHQL